MPASEAPSPPRPSRRRWWWPERRRSITATVVATVATFAVVTAWIVANPDDAVLALPLGTALTWAVLVGIHAALTAVAFSGLAGDALEAAIAASGARRPSRGAWPAWSVQVSVMALIVVAVLVAVPEFRDHSLLLVAGLAMVAASWADAVVASALHYAANAGEALEFPDDGPRTFGDYVYVALAVQSTFAVPDVTVRSSALRRQVSVHSAIAFVFSTVIVAVIVALLLGARAALSRRRGARARAAAPRPPASTRPPRRRSPRSVRRR